MQKILLFGRFVVQKKRKIKQCFFAVIDTCRLLIYNNKKKIKPVPN